MGKIIRLFVFFLIQLNIYLALYAAAGWTAAEILLNMKCFTVSAQLTENPCMSFPLNGNILKVTSRLQLPEAILFVQSAISYGHEYVLHSCISIRMECFELVHLTAGLT